MQMRGIEGKNKCTVYRTVRQFFCFCIFVFCMLYEI